jgi:3-phenylpropionate/trans-cinnamate dioxygenase ferredoxin subunit
MDWIKIFVDANEANTVLTENQPRLLVIKNKRICLARHQGKIHAVQDKCTHNGESLSKGKINYQGEVICPWHGYRFNLKTGRECMQQISDLECYPIKENEEGVFIGV